MPLLSNLLSVMWLINISRKRAEPVIDQCKEQKKKKTEKTFIKGKQR